MTDSRPTPEQMLARIKTEADQPSHRQQGKLKIFFGYAAGVGKTYAMLQAARKLKTEKIDVVVGYVEPHGRPETEALLEGLECLPPLVMPYRGANLQELDLDAALNRKPAVVLVDELAHTNAPGCRHAKRWQDVQELLAAGIDVHTTVNVQHLESLNDVVSQISSVTVRETIPDSIFERADEVILIDLTPDELLERLGEGKVYVPTQARRALEHFFRKSNLVALRELSLREVADRVHTDVEAARMGSRADLPWPTNERLLVAIGPSPTSAKVIRACKRLADTLRAPWIALFVDTPSTASLSSQDRDRIQRHLLLAERLGSEIVTLSGEDIAQETISYARSRNVTKIVIGKSNQKSRGFFRRDSLVVRLLRDSGNIDVYVIRGIEDPLPTRPPSKKSKTGKKAWLEMILVLALTTFVALGLCRIDFSEANIVMVYLLGVIIIASRCGTTISLVASFLSVIMFDVLFTKPFYTLVVHDSQYLLTFAVMLVVAIMASTLANRIRRQAEISRKNERRTEALYRLSRRLTAFSGINQLVTESEKAIADVFHCHAVLFLPNQNKKIRPIIDSMASFAADASEVAAAQWVFDRGQPAGSGTDTLPNLAAFYLPLTTPSRIVGVLSVQPVGENSLQFPESRQLLETYCTQIAFALERDQLAQENQNTRLEMETEKLRSSLLSAVSHDLRTPLAVMAGASSSLLESENPLPPETRKELLESIYEESIRLTRLIENLLNITRLSSGKITLNREWQPVEEVIGSTIRRIKTLLRDRPLQITISEQPLFGFFDPVLLEQVLMNLLDNAVKYSPENSALEIRAFRQGQSLHMEVRDKGQGIVPGEEEKIFDKFFRGSSSTGNRRGAGLGLAICKAVIDAHGGSIMARNHPQGGAIISFRLPLPESPPNFLLEDDETREISP